MGVVLSSKADHPAIQAAAQEINAAGGVGGVPLELLGLDWDIREKNARTDVTEWCDRFAATPDLVAVVGPSDSASTLVVARALNERKIPELVTIATHPSITNIGAWTYRLCISDAAQGPALAEYAVNDWKKTRIVVFAVNDDYGRGLSQSFGNRARKLGADVLSTTFHQDALPPSDRQMLKGVLEAQKKQPPDLVVLFQRPAAAEWTVRAIRESGLAVDILGGDNLDPDGFLKQSPELLEGFRYSEFFFPRPEEPKSMAFVERFKKAGLAVDYGGAFAYDAVQLIAEAAQKNGATREGVKAGLDQIVQEKRSVSGATGSFGIGADHDGRRPLYVVEYRNGVKRLVKAVPVG